MWIYLYSLLGKELETIIIELFSPEEKIVRDQVRCAIPELTLKYVFNFLVISWHLLIKIMIFMNIYFLFYRKCQLSVETEDVLKWTVAMLSPFAAATAVVAFLRYRISHFFVIHFFFRIRPSNVSLLEIWFVIIL